MIRFEGFRFAGFRFTRRFGQRTRVARDSTRCEQIAGTQVATRHSMVRNLLRDAPVQLREVRLAHRLGLPALRRDLHAELHVVRRPVRPPAGRVREVGKDLRRLVARVRRKRFQRGGRDDPRAQRRAEVLRACNNQ